MTTSCLVQELLLKSTYLICYLVGNPSGCCSRATTGMEREHVMSGNLDQLVEEQRRIDEEKDAEVRAPVWGGEGGGR